MSYLLRGDRLYNAIDRGDYAKVKYLIEKGYNINKKYKHGQLPLHRAASSIVGPIGRKVADPCTAAKIAQLLIDNGAEVDACSDTYLTPLHIASMHGNTKVAKVLLENGANVNMQGDAKITPLLFAVEAYNTNIDIVKILISYGADCNLRDQWSDTPLQAAVMSENIEIVKYLLYYCANSSETDENIRKAFELAVNNNENDIAYLIKSYLRREIESGKQGEN